MTPSRSSHLVAKVHDSLVSKLGGKERDRCYKSANSCEQLTTGAKLLAAIFSPRATIALVTKAPQGVWLCTRENILYKNPDKRSFIRSFLFPLFQQGLHSLTQKGHIILGEMLGRLRSTGETPAMS
ncbi:hypothetical protein V2G26_002543 [Clonostachys chloroleuca]